MWELAQRRQLPGRASSSGDAQAKPNNTTFFSGIFAICKTLGMRIVVSVPRVNNFFSSLFSGDRAYMLARVVRKSTIY